MTSRIEIRIAFSNETVSAVSGSTSMYFAERTLTRLIIEPIERSIPPEMITTAWPIAANASGSASIASDCTSNVPHCAGIVPPVEDEREQQHVDAGRPGVAAREPAPVDAGAAAGDRRVRRAHAASSPSRPCIARRSVASSAVEAASSAVIRPL